MTEHQNIPPSPGSPTILVVDDEPSIIKLCKTLLEATGFTVLQAESIGAALGGIFENLSWYVLLDVKSPIQTQI